MRALASRARKLTGRLLTGKNLRATLIRGGVGSILVKGLQAVIALLLTVALARVLGPEQFGVYSFVLAALMLVAIPTQVGAPQLLVRETAKYAVTGDWSRVRGVWRWANRLVLGLSLAAIAVLAVALWLTGTNASLVTLQTAVAGCALIPLIALANLRAASLRGLKHVVIGQLPEKIIRPAILLLLVFGAGLTTLFEPFTAQFAMGGHVIAAIVAFVVGWLLLARNRTAQVVFRHSPVTEQTAWRKAIVPLSLITGFQMVNSHIDVLALGFFQEPKDVGVYRALSQLSISMLFGVNALQLVVQPYFSALHASGNHTKLQAVVERSATAVSVISLMLFVPLFFFSSEVLRVFFGMEYQTGATTLKILMVGIFFKASLGLGATLLTMTGKEKSTMLITGSSAMINILLNVVLIPPFGMEGAALATTLTFILWSLWLKIECKREIGINITPFRSKILS